MAIRSKIASAVVPDLKTVKDVFGIDYGGVTFKGLCVQSSPSSFYGNPISCSRIFCSCGYSAAKIPVDAEYGYGGHCPECGRPLLNLESAWGSAEEYNTKKCSSSITTIKGNVMTISTVEFSLKPNFPAHLKAPKDADYLNSDYLETLKFEAKSTEEAVLEKNPDGTIKFTCNTKHRLCVPKTDETSDFFGWLGDVFLQNRAIRGDVYYVEFNILDAVQHFPTVFSKENHDKLPTAWSEALALHMSSGDNDYKGDPIPKDATIEEFFEAKGYPMALMPLNFVRRNKVLSTPEELQEFLETSIGKIISARVTNGQEIDYSVLDSIVDIALVIKGKKLDKKYHGFESLFEPYMKDAIDHYGMTDDDLVEIFLQRINTLREQGIMPSEDTIRTRTYNSIIHPNHFQLKKDVNIVQCISDNPIEALKYLQVKKNS